MQTTRARAVAACLPSTARDACLAALEGAGYAAAAVAGDADEAIGLVRSLRPSVVLADAILPGGDGVALAERLVRTPLDLYPWLLLRRPAGLRLPGEDRLHDLGAQVIDPPVTADAVSRAVSVCEARADRLPPFKAERLEALMTDLGVPIHPGREMLMRAVALCWRDAGRVHNLRDLVYPPAGAALGRSAEQAERAIRHVIEAAWRTGEIDRQQAIFGDTVDARRGRPTCGEMIAQLADILRWEG